MAMPAAGLPVASITTSTPSHRRSVEPAVEKRVAGDPRARPSRRCGRRRARAVGIEIGDHRDLQARDRRDLRQEHRAELAGADQAGPDRPPGLDTGGKLVHQVHGLMSFGSRLSAAPGRTARRIPSSTDARRGPSPRYGLSNGGVIGACAVCAGCSAVATIGRTGPAATVWSARPSGGIGWRWPI